MLLQHLTMRWEMGDATGLVVVGCWLVDSFVVLHCPSNALTAQDNKAAGTARGTAAGPFKSTLLQPGQHSVTPHSEAAADHTLHSSYPCRVFMPIQG